MILYTGEYIEHFDPENPRLKFYSFTPSPLMRGDLYQMDDELAALLIEAHRNIGFLKECTYSHMIDYDDPDFKEILLSAAPAKVV